MMIKEEVINRLRIMRRQEDSVYQCTDYLLDVPASPYTIDSLCRLKMIQWCYQVIDFINFRRETVSIAISYLDRFLSSNSGRAHQVIHSRKDYQLAVMTTLYMAIKINEQVAIDLNLLKELSRGSYTVEEFRKMENDILFGLDWRVSGPSVLSFVEHFIALLKCEQLTHISFNQQTERHQTMHYEKLIQLIKYDVELSVGEYKLMTEKPSVIAAAAIRNSIDSAYNVKTRALFLQQFESILSFLQVDQSSILFTQQCMCKLKNQSSSNVGIMTLQPTTATPSPTQGQMECSKNPTSSEDVHTNDAVIGSTAISRCIGSSPNCVSRKKTRA